MTLEAAILRALDMPADAPGVARLCQELLSDVTGKPITCTTPAPVRMLGGRLGGNRRRI